MSSRSASEDRAVQIDVFANELGGDFGPDADRGPARPWPVDPAETRFIGEQDPQAAASPGSQPACVQMTLVAAIFFVGLRRLLALSETLALAYPIKKWAAAFAIAGAVFYDLATGSRVGPSARCS